MSERPAFDLIIKGGRYFDGSSRPSALRNIGLRNGRVVAVSTKTLDETGCPDVIDAGGQWVMPGFIDTHTRYDAEVLASPGLCESVRHGVTSVVFGAGSISTVCSDTQDCADLFARTESIPREHVLPLLRRKKTWRTPSEYIAHLAYLPLGPNVATFLGHSDLRVSVMGLARAMNRNESPSAAELYEMESLLVEALDAGMLGLSTVAAPWQWPHLNRAPERHQPALLPSACAGWFEFHRLSKLLRERGRVHQVEQHAGDTLSMLRPALASAGWLRKPLKTTVSTSTSTNANTKTSNSLHRSVARMAQACNTLLSADFRWQALPCPPDARPHSVAQARAVVQHPGAILSASGAGAHIGSAAFYNFPIQTLKLVFDAERKGRPFMRVERAVWRLTGELGQWFGIDAGRLRLGDRADIVIINPDGLDASVTAQTEASMAEFGNLKRLVNRNDQAVTATIINGRLAYRQGRFAPTFGFEPGYGRVLRAGETPARPGRVEVRPRAAQAA